MLSIIWLTGGGVSLNASSSSSSIAAAADDELEPLKYPLILDLELDTFVSSGLYYSGIAAADDELEPLKYPLLLDAVADDIISSICVGSDKLSSKISVIASSFFLSYL